MSRLVMVRSSSSGSSVLPLTTCPEPTSFTKSNADARDEAIELNLRLPSMLHGKKGFERIAWAFRNVLSQTVTWLFHDLDGANDGTGPLAAHAPVTFTVDPHIENLDHVLVPDLPSTLDQQNEAYAVVMLEWLTLNLSSAPCVRETGAAETYLSRYQVPRFDDAVGPKVQDLVKLSYQGFLPSAFISTILLASLRKSSAEDNPWFVISAASFDGEAYAILRTEGRILVWEYMD
nr:hypothetical protein CFP56_00885 [Quercus suber]